uniref:Chemosensory protein 3 n=1 Tax=Anopheles farauti TaxID=69004 RepID=A0A182Q2T4_9DIPT
MAGRHLKQTFLAIMKVFVAIAFALLALAAAQEQYTTKYDGIDLDEILKSDRLFNNYFKCLMDEGRCTPDGNELKKILPEALQTNCAKCSEKQRAGAIRVINYVIENRKEQWEALQKKYDPENLYIEKYREEAKKEGINLE